MVDTTLDGRCFCGNVLYRISGQARNPAYCHCESCRRAAGSPFVAWGTFTYDRFAVTGSDFAEYRSSPDVTRGFCKACGTSLTYRHDARPDEIDVTLVTLEDPTAVIPESHIWVEDKLAYVDISDSLPQYLTVPGGENASR